MKVAHLCGQFTDGIYTDVIKVSESAPESPDGYKVLGYQLVSGEVLEPTDPSLRHFKAQDTGRIVHIVRDEPRDANRLRWNASPTWL